MGFFDLFKPGKKKEEAKPGAKQKPRTEAEKLDEGIAKTKSGFWGKISRAVAGKSRIDNDTLDDLEEALITADVGVETTGKIIDRLEERIARDKYMNMEEFHRLLHEEVVSLMDERQEVRIPPFTAPEDKKPYVIMVVGVNGAGKTTTIGKLAHRFKAQGKQVVLGAADTYRAAAIEQLEIWGERAGVPVSSRQMGADPGAVAYDTVNSARAKGADVVIVDTAGRLHNKKHLMEELAKVKRVMKKVIEDAPHEILLVLDASTGQNAIEQARQFIDIIDVNAIALTKLDGTAKGGVIIGIIDQFEIPIKYVGVGEQVEDLQAFDSARFVESLFKKEVA